MWHCESGCREVRKEVTWAGYDSDAWAISRVRYRQADPVRLVGDFHTILCPGCRQAWHKFIIPKQAYKDLRKLERDRRRLEISCFGRAEIAEESHHEKRYDKIQEEIDAADEILFHIAEMWLTERKEEQTKIGFELEKKFKAEEKERHKKEAEKPPAQ